MGDKMDIINYKNSILNLSNSILKYFDIKPFHQTLSYVDDLLENKKYDNVVILLCDGLGSKNLDLVLKQAGFLKSHKIKNLTSVFPTTTTAATTSVLTGLMPSEHNWYGWDMYFKDTNETISLFLNKIKDSKKSPKLSISKRDYMQNKTIIDLIRENGDKAYYAYPFDYENPCYDLDSVCERIIKLTKEPGKKFIYGYIENPDKLMHKYGVYSKQVKEEIKKINDKIENLSKSVENTIIFVIADHGLVTTKTINLKNDMPKIYDMLKRTTTLESRATGIKLKNKKLLSEFKRQFDVCLRDDFHLLSREEVMNSKLFGENPNEYLMDTVGDYLLIAKGDKVINYDDMSPIFKASHAGLTTDEILVPLIVIECDKTTS